jgi:hypothetical protein
MRKSTIKATKITHEILFIILRIPRNAQKVLGNNRTITDRQVNLRRKSSDNRMLESMLQ